jgi:hypothetical protein
MKPDRTLSRRLAACVAGASMLCAATAAPPQTVYRCGPDGRVYSQTPCADGRPVTTEDTRSASQQKSAREVAERDAQQAQKLADERRQREAAAKGQPVVGIRTTPADDGASAAKSKPKPKAKASAADGTMSPAMRVAPQPAAPK